MSGTWLDFCVVRRGPATKCGYPGVSRRTLLQIEGEVDHSMEGPTSAALGELDKLTRMASWTFSVPNVGPPLQHYALEDITWHCGLPGDRRTDTSLIGNLTLVGIEHEDYPDNELNANQLYWSVRITQAIRDLCPLVGGRPPLRRVNLWEHRELSSTSCPSGLIPWDEKIQSLEDEMTDEDENRVRAIVSDMMGTRGPGHLPNIIDAGSLKGELGRAVGHPHPRPTESTTPTIYATPDEARAIAQEEDGKLKVTK